MTRHPNYKTSLFYNDIALIELDHDVEFSETIHPACLWTEANEDLLINKSVISACGFGVEGEAFACMLNLKYIKLLCHVCLC
jgi:Trypsin